MSKPKPQPSEFFNFCQSMYGIDAIDKNGKMVPKFLLFWHYGCKNEFDVMDKNFELAFRPKNNQIL